MRKILFGPHPDWERRITERIDPSRFHVTFADLGTADLASFDLVVPLRLQQLNALWSAGAAVRTLIPSRAVCALCDDKLALARRLQAEGFGPNIPPIFEGDPPYPHIRKARRGLFGKGCEVILSPDRDEAPLDPASEFRQACVLGADEYVTHVIRAQGAIRFARTYRYTMDGEHAVRGYREKPLLCERAEAGMPLETLAAMLASIGYEGTCCLNYKLREGRVMLFEINPRFGGSLVRDVDAYVAAHLKVFEDGEEGLRVGNLRGEV